MKNNIKKLREEYNLTQKDIGELLSKSQQSISRLEKGQRDIDIYELCILADHFNVSTDYILGRTKNKNTPDVASAFETILIENYSTLKELRNLNLTEKAIVTSIIANCVNLIKLNTPNFFAKEEVNDLSNYLDKGIELYYVLLVDGKVVGCGGINFAEKRTIGKISWDIMHPDYQGKSLGKKLLRYRIEVLKAIPSIKKITVRTSQLAYKFYEKQGFTLNEIKRNYWADGFDMYSMQYNEL